MVAQLALSHRIMVVQKFIIWEYCNSIQVDLKFMSLEKFTELTCKVFGQIFPSNEKIENINDQYWTLRAEEVKFVSFYPV